MTRLWAGQFTFGTSARARDFSLHQNIQTGCGVLLSHIKEPRCEVDRWYPSSAKVKNKWSNSSTCPYVFMAWTVTALTLIFPFFSPLFTGALHVLRNVAVLDNYFAGCGCQFADETHSRVQGKITYTAFQVRTVHLNLCFKVFLSSQP